MKILALISLVVFPSILFAQGATCVDMDPICTDVGASFTANTGTTSEPGNNYGCLATQPNPSWYYFEIATNGNIDMSLTAGSDIDFIIWGPFANLAAAQANCGSLGANVDCSYSATNNETPSIPGAVAGQVYIMLITNYASVVQDITLVQTGGTGSTNCTIVTNPPCFMSYFEATVGACDPLTGTYTVTGSVEFDDPPVSGNLIVQDCDGNQTIVASAPFTVNASGEGVENFTLPGLDPDGGPCSVTAFFSADPTCTQVLNYTAPECICNFNYLSVNISACDDATGTFNITGFVEFESPPTTGTMTVTDCNGYSQVFTAPFTSPQNFTLSNLVSDGTTNCTVTASFSADPGCSITSPSFNYPACVIGPNCPVDIGSFTTSVAGSSSTGTQLCFGDSFIINPTGDFIPPDDIGDDGTFSYNPGLWLMIYDCPPTIIAPNDFLGDPCMLGGWETTDPAGPWSVDNIYGDNSTYYFVPVTFYDYVNGVYSYYSAGTLCYDMGPAYEVTFLAPIIENTVEDCFAGTATSTISGGAPSFDGSNFNIVPGTLLPATASFVNTTCGNGGTITITGLLDGQAYSYDVEDQNGCPITVSDIFNGLQNANFTYNFKYCQDEADPTATITGVPGGDFTSSPAGLVFLNTTTGLIDLSASATGTYTITYESPAATCWGTETFVLSINPLPLVNATEDSPICDDGISTIQLGETGGEATEWLWSSNGSATITDPTDQNPIVSNDAVNGEIFTVLVTNVNTGCTNTDQVSVIVTPMNTIAPGTNQTVCLNSAMTNISLATTGATGATFAGLPAGVTGAWAGNVATISGTPSVSGTFNYTVTTTGGCPPATTTGTITVNPLNTIAAGTNQTVCINSAIVNITMATTGATGATFAGLPAGVTGAWAGNVATISGTPAASGTFNYTVTTTGGCPPATTTGTITVTPLNTIAAGTNQTVCINSAIANITLATTGATGATFTGLPAGVTGVWAGNVATISGTPSASGTFNYTVTTTGGCPPATATGTITVNSINTIAAGTNQTVCMNSAITNITLATTGATGATFAGLPAGVTGAWAGNVATISGTPTASGTFNYTVTTTGGCPPATTTGTITVTPLNTIAAGTNQTVCMNSAITNITLATTGATGATFAGLPAGVTGVWAGNVATISGTPTVAGTFNYTVTTTGGCPPATTTGTITVTPLNTIAAGSDQTVCINSAITNITLATTGATGATFAGLPAGVTGSWAGNIVTISGAPTASGTFNYTVTTTGGCPPATATGTITVNPLEDASFTLTDFCEGGANSATVTGVPGGTFAFNPMPGDGATINPSTGEISNEVSGTTYTVEYTSPGTCFNSSTETVTVNPGPTPVISGVLQYCAGQTTTLSTTIAYSSYVWSTGVITPTASVTIADNPITVQVTDALGCIGTSVAVNVSENSVFVYDINLEICQGESVDIHGNMESVAGVYSQTFTLPTGCDSTANVTLIVNPLPIVDAGVATTICNGESTLLGASGAITYSWDNGLGAGNNFNVSPAINTTYTVTGTDGNGCENTDNVIITVNPIPTASIAGTTTICDGDASPDITITGANGTAPYTFTYNINGGADLTVVSVGNDAVISVPNTPSGVYNYNLVSVEDASATTCSQTQVGTATVTINANPNPSIIGDVDYCEGFTATISANQAYTTYDWSTGAVTQSIDVTTADNPITLTVTNAFGCSGTSAVYNIIENPTPAIDAGPDVTICLGGSTDLSASGATTYSWDNGIGAGNNISVSPVADITYVVTGTDANGCVGTDDISIVVNDPPTAFVMGSATICENDPSPTITFSGSNGTEPYTFTYNINGGPNLTVTSVGATADVIVPNNPSGVYVYNLVSVEESSANNCSQSQIGSAVITINSLPAVNAGVDQVACGNDEITLTASGANSYVWDNGVMNGVPFVPSTGNYTVIGTDGNGCTNSDVVSVLVSPVPMPDFDAVYNSCEPFIVTLTNTTPGISANCVWQISNGSAPISGCGPITLTMGQAGSYDVTLTTSTLDGCTASITELDAFAFEEAPNASFTPYNTTLTTLNTEVQFENESTGASSYDWTFGDNSGNSSATNPVHTYDENETGNYLVTLIAYSNAGCSDTAYGYIRVEEEIIYYVPNTFTPDNDSYNQFFQPVFTSGYDPFDYTLLIFDRWGEIIFESHDVTKGWDGTYSGNYNVQDGTYTWKIEFKTSINDKRIMDVGHVNVIR